MQRVPPSQVIYNGSANATSYPNIRGPFNSPYDACLHSNQQYSNGNYPAANTFCNGYQSQMRGSPPRSYLTITQFNYQPLGYNYPNQVMPNALYRPPANNRWPDKKNCFYTPNLINADTRIGPSNDKSIEAALLKERASYNTNQGKDKTMDQSFYISRNNDFLPQLEQNKDNPVWTGTNQDSYPLNPQGTVSQESDNPLCNEVYPDSFLESLVNADPDIITKFIADGCLKAESIATRNQYRPCFKNIPHLCNKTKLDILKPKCTMANIHSQGIPWVTKDFICAFIRLVNSWYTLKGYLEEPNENLGKIQSALKPEFKECYYDWQILNRKMVGHLINVFVNLDNGITVQNKRIYSTFNSLKAAAQSETSNSNNITTGTTNINSEESAKKKSKKATETKISDNKSACYKQKPSNVRGILRLKEIFNTDDESSTDEETTDEGCQPNNYIDSEKNAASPISDDKSSTSHSSGSVQPIECEEISEKITVNCNSNNAEDSQNLKQNQDDIWQNAVQSIHPFMETAVKDSTTLESLNAYQSNACHLANYNIITNNENNFDNNSKEQSRNLENNSLTFFNRNKYYYKDNYLYNGLFPSFVNKEAGLSMSVKEKFKKILDALLEVKFVKYIMLEANSKKIPENFKYLNKPWFFYTIKENLDREKYIHSDQVVYDLKSIVNEARLYSEEKPNWWFGNSMLTFSKEVEFQLSQHFPTLDFSHVKGETPEAALLENSTEGKTNGTILI